MEYLNKETAIARMNELSTSHVPFIFIIDYEAKRSIVLPVSKVNPDECLFDFGTVSNAAQAQAENTEAVSWQGNFPTPETYRKSFDTVENYLKAGDISLINLTCRVPVSTNLSLRDIFAVPKLNTNFGSRIRWCAFRPRFLCASKTAKSVPTP